MRKDRKSEYRVVVERHFGPEILIRLYADIDYGFGSIERQDHFFYANDLNDVIKALESAMPDIAHLERHPQMQSRPRRKSKA